MKKGILFLAILFIATSTFAQEQGKMRFGFNVGATFPKAGIGIDGNLDFRYNILDNLNVGLQLGLAGGIKDLNIDDANSTFSATSTGITSTILSGDYYFNKGTSIFAPFLGAGLGFYNVGGVNLTTTGNSSTTVDIDPNLILMEKKVGGLLRAGFESGHFRLGLDYYLIPTSTINRVDETLTVLGQTTSVNSYVKLSLGFYFWGGHWKK